MFFRISARPCATPQQRAQHDNDITSPVGSMEETKAGDAVVAGGGKQGGGGAAPAAVAGAGAGGDGDSNVPVIRASVLRVRCVCVPCACVVLCATCVLPCAWAHIMAAAVLVSCRVCVAHARLRRAAAFWSRRAWRLAALLHTQRPKPRHVAAYQPT